MFPILCLDYSPELVMGRFILGLEDHEVEINEGVIDSRFKENPGNQAPKMVQSVHSDLHHYVLVRNLEVQITCCCLLNREERESTVVF